MVRSLVGLPTTIISVFRHSGGAGGAVLGVYVNINLTLPLLFIVMPLLVGSSRTFDKVMVLVFDGATSVVNEDVFKVIVKFFVISCTLSLGGSMPLVGANFSPTIMSPAVTVSFLSILSLYCLDCLFSRLSCFFGTFFNFLPRNCRFAITGCTHHNFFRVAVVTTVGFTMVFLYQLLAGVGGGGSTTTMGILSAFVSIFALVVVFATLDGVFLCVGDFNVAGLHVAADIFVVFLTTMFVDLVLGLCLENIGILGATFITTTLSLVVLNAIGMGDVVTNCGCGTCGRSVLRRVSVRAVTSLNSRNIPCLILLARTSSFSMEGRTTCCLSLTCSSCCCFICGRGGRCGVRGQVCSRLNGLDVSERGTCTRLSTCCRGGPSVLACGGGCRTVPSSCRCKV